MNVKKIEQLKKSKPFKIMDICLLVLVVGMVVFCYILLFGTGGESVDIFDNGTKNTYSLKIDREIITSGGHLTITIKDGMVWVSDADCDNHLCIASGKKSKIHQSIVCIPNNIVINITGESDLDGVV